MDYDSDEDPLGYMTSDYRSPYLIESRIDMQRRFFLRGRRAPHLWQRVLVRLMIAVPLAINGLSLMVGGTHLITDFVSK